MKSARTVDMTTGSITKKLLVFAFPLIVTNILQHLYSAADSAVVGRFAGKAALAAVGATASATGLLTNLLIGIAVGGNIVNSNLLGAQKHRELRKSMHTGIAMSALCGIGLMILGILVCKPLLQLMQCPENIIDQSTLYMRIIFCGIPGSILYNFAAGILRTHGDSKRPMMVISICGLVNVLLNLLFVIGFKMSVAGVGWATVISNYLSAIWLLYILFDPKDEFKLTMGEMKIHKEQCVNIMKVGIPCAINSMVFSLSNVTVSASINTFGDTVIAGSTAATQLSTFLNQVISAFYTACITFAGQCYGAGKFKRIDQVLWIGGAYCVLIVAALATIITVAPGFFMGIFNSDPDVIYAGTRKLILISWSFVMYSISDVLLGCLRGIKKTAIPTTLNIFCVCVVRILWVMFICPIRPDSYMLIYWCYPVSYVCSMTSLFVYYAYCRKRFPVQQKAEV